MDFLEEYFLERFLDRGGFYFFLFPVSLYLVKGKSSWKQLLFYSRDRARDSFYGVLSGIFLYILFHALFFLEKESFPQIGLLEEWNAWSLLFFLTAVFLGPVTEELLIRKWLYGNLRKHVSLLLALLLSSFVFALLHLDFSFWALGYYTIAGLVLALLFEKRGGLYACILAHSVGNFLLLSVKFFP